MHKAGLGSRWAVLYTKNEAPWDLPSWVTEPEELLNKEKYIFKRAHKLRSSIAREPYCLEKTIFYWGSLYSHTWSRRGRIEGWVWSHRAEQGLEQPKQAKGPGDNHRQEAAKGKEIDNKEAEVVAGKEGWGNQRTCWRAAVAQDMIKWLGVWPGREEKPETKEQARPHFCCFAVWSKNCQRRWKWT